MGQRRQNGNKAHISVTRIHKDSVTRIHKDSVTGFMKVCFQNFKARSANSTQNIKKSEIGV